MTDKKNKEKKPTKEEELSQQVSELTETLQRLQAEFENYKKRTEMEKNQCRKYAEEELIKSILPLMDNFELALKNKHNKEEFIKGIELLYSQLFQLMEERGLKPVQAEGQSFDPRLHEALLVEESDKNNIILEELQKGYLLYGKVIRHSKVKVGKKDRRSKKWER